MLPADGSPDLKEETYIVPPAPDEIRSEPETTASPEEPAAAVPEEGQEPVYEDVSWEENWADDGYEEEYWEDYGYAEEEWADEGYEDTYWEEEGNNEAGWEEDGWQEEDYVYQEEGYEEPYWDDEN